VYFANFSKGGEAVESCPYSADLVHDIVLEQGIRIMDRITGYALPPAAAFLAQSQ
jgi:hypothetical protein